MTEKYCSNCCKNINAATFFLHERMCSLNVKKCPKCNKPFTIDDLEDHMIEAHTDVECEFCKKKFLKSEIEKHKIRCDSKMVPCSFCEMDVLLGELKEHQKACGAITEPCIKCNRYIQRKNMDKHLMDGCPQPKNDRRSVDVMRNSSKLSLGKDNNNINDNNYNNNYIPIDINDYIPDEIFFDDDNKKNVDIKIHDNIKKPNLPIRPPSGKRLLNEAAKKTTSNIGNNNSNKITNPINIINDKKETNIKSPSSNNITNNINNNSNIKNPQIKKPVRKETEKTKTNNFRKDKDKDRKNDYLNKQNNLNKPAVVIKPAAKDTTIKLNNYSNANKNTNMSNSRYNFRGNNKKLSSKPALNISKGSMKIQKEKESEEEFRRTRDKLTFKEAKNLSNKNMNSNIKNKNINSTNIKKDNIKKNDNNTKKSNKIINDEDFIANFNFGDVGDDEQLMQEIIEQSLKDQKKK